jgi:hypothetical protein
VKVGGLRYRVVAWHPAGSAASERFGETSHSELEIRVATHHGADRTREVLLHEVMHAVCHVYLQAPARREEHFIRAAGMGLAQVLADNPELRRALLSGDVHGGRPGPGRSRDGGASRRDARPSVDRRGRTRVRRRG